CGSEGSGSVVRRGIAGWQRFGVFVALEFLLAFPSSRRRSLRAMRGDFTIARCSTGAGLDSQRISGRLSKGIDAQYAARHASGGGKHEGVRGERLLKS